jgi:hypothetical protein
MRFRIFLAVALPLLLAGVAGCGGGGETTATPVATATETTPTLSKKELITQGDAICAEVNAAVGTVSSTGANSTTTAARASQIAQLYSGMVGRLKGLGTPGEATGYTEFISAAEALAKAEGDARLAAERGESSALEAAESKASPALASFQSAANAYGLKKCGEAPSAPTPGSTAPASGKEAPSGGAEATAPEATPEATPETGGGGSVEAGGGAPAGGGSAGGGSAGGGGGGGGSSSGGIGPG